MVTVRLESLTLRQKGAVRTPIKMGSYFFVAMNVFEFELTLPKPQEKRTKTFSPF